MAESAQSDLILLYLSLGVTFNILTYEHKVPDFSIVTGKGFILTPESLRVNNSGESAQHHAQQLHVHIYVTQATVGQY